MERLATWTGWIMAGMSFIGAACFHLRWHDAAGALPMVIGGVLLATIALVRQRMLDRKKAALIQAIARYEKMLAEPPRH